jgi:hypothetical protein
MYVERPRWVNLDAAVLPLRAAAGPLDRQPRPFVRTPLTHLRQRLIKVAFVGYWRQAPQGHSDNNWLISRRSRQEFFQMRGGSCVLRKHGRGSGMSGAV